MAEAVLEPGRLVNGNPRSWLGSIWLHPRATYAQVVAQSKAVWLLPLLVLSVSVVLNVAVSGRLKQIAAQSGQVQLPPDFEYYSPEQQAQLMQAWAATSGPAFVYVIPALGRLTIVWVSWLLVGSLLHLAMTLIGGRGDTARMLNVVAWASLPLSLRELVRAGAMLVTHQAIQNPGLSGFAPGNMGNGALYLSKLLASIDIYTIWYMILIGIGASATRELPPRKTWLVMIITIIFWLLFQALVGFGLAQLNGLQITRPFFY